MLKIRDRAPLTWGAFLLSELQGQNSHGFYRNTPENGSTNFSQFHILKINGCVILKEFQGVACNKCKFFVMGKSDQLVLTNVKRP